MRTKNQLPETCEDVISEIAAILAQGYLRYRRSRQMSPGMAENQPESEQSRPDMEKTT